MNWFATLPLIFIGNGRLFEKKRIASRGWWSLYLVENMAGPLDGTSFSVPSK